MTMGEDAGRPIASLAFYLDGELLAIAAGHHVGAPCSPSLHALWSELAVSASFFSSTLSLCTCMCCVC